MFFVLLGLKTRSIDPGDGKSWTPTLDADWSRFKAVLNGEYPRAIRVLLKSDKFFEVQSSRTKDITDQLKNLPSSTDITSWSSLGNYQLLIYANDTAYWTYYNTSTNHRTDVKTQAFRGVDCKISVLNIEGIGSQATLTTLVTYGNLWTLRKIKFGDPIEAWRDTQWMTTSEFLGCPRSVCFDGHIDAILNGGKNTLFLYIGQYVVYVSADGSINKPYEHKLFVHDDNGSGW